jgi:hypothetical protein
MATNYTRSNIVFSSDHALTNIDTVQEFPVHTIREEDGKTYRYVKFDNGAGNVAAVAGNLCYWTATSGTVTSDESDSSIPAGIFMAVLTDGSWGWIQTRGLATVNNEGTDIALGAAMIASSTDGKATSIVAAEFTTTAATLAQINRCIRVIGYAPAAVTDTSGACFLTLE